MDWIKIVLKFHSSDCENLAISAVLNLLVTCPLRLNLKIFNETDYQITIPMERVGSMPNSIDLWSGLPCHLKFCTCQARDKLELHPTETNTRISWASLIRLDWFKIKKRIITGSQASLNLELLSPVLVGVWSFLTTILEKTLLPAELSHGQFDSACQNHFTPLWENGY